MKRKRFIPLLLVLTLSTSALSFSPTWGEPANESGNSVLTEEDGVDVTSSSNMVSTHYSPLEVMASYSDFPGGEEFEDLFAFEKLNKKEDFYRYFGDNKLNPISVSINLDKEEYYKEKTEELITWTSPAMQTAIRFSQNLPRRFGRRLILLLLWMTIWF